jgi:ribonuclease D
MVKQVIADIPEDWYHEILFKSPLIGMDIETSGLDRVRDKIACVQIYVPTKGTLLLRTISDYPSKLIAVLEHKEIKKIFHHAPFDISFLARDYHIWANNIACTKVAVKILDPDKTMFKSHSLWYLLKELFGVEKNRELTVSDWFTSYLSEAQIQYAETDVKYLIDLLALLEGQLLSRGKLKLAREVYKNIPTYIQLEMQNYRDVYGY